MAKNMGKRHYEMLAQACREIEAGLSDIPWLVGSQCERGEIMELIVARLAYACAQDNPAFDSQIFVAKARGRKPYA